MNPFELHPEFYDQPIHLTPEEMSDPRATLREIFSQTSLSEMRRDLWKMVEACVGTPDPGTIETPEQRQDILMTYYEVERALDAAALLAARRKEERTIAKKTA